jgi:hypothetical protein
LGEHIFNVLAQRESLFLGFALQSTYNLYPTLGEENRLKILFNDLCKLEDKVSATVFNDDWSQ